MPSGASSSSNTFGGGLAGFPSRPSGARPAFPSDRPLPFCDTPAAIPRSCSSSGWCSEDLAGSGMGFVDQQERRGQPLGFGQRSKTASRGGGGVRRGVGIGSEGCPPLQISTCSAQPPVEPSKNLTGPYGSRRRRRAAVENAQRFPRSAGRCGGRQGRRSFPHSVNCPPTACVALDAGKILDGATYQPRVRF